MGADMMSKHKVLSSFQLRPAGLLPLDKCPLVRPLDICRNENKSRTLGTKASSGNISLRIEQFITKDLSVDAGVHLIP